MVDTAKSRPTSLLGTAEGPMRGATIESKTRRAAGRLKSLGIQVARKSRLIIQVARNSRLVIQVAGKSRLGIQMV